MTRTTRPFLFAAFIVLALLALVLFARSESGAQPSACRAGLATRHEAWDSVFDNFPERLRDDVHGYIAVQDCAEMGSLYTLHIGKSAYTVAVADCRNRAATLRPGWLVDVDDRLWYASDTPNRPVSARLCPVPDP